KTASEILTLHRACRRIRASSSQSGAAVSHIVHRSLNHDYPRAVAGDGPYLIDSNGRRYIDASSGAAVSCLGHSDREVIAAIKDQLDRLPYAHPSFFSTEPAELLADDLVAHAPQGLE